MIAAAVGAALKTLQGAFFLPAQAAGPFALAPGLVPVPAIDMLTLDGIKVYNASTEPLEP
jgi:hypothetical protein